MLKIDSMVSPDYGNTNCSMALAADGKSLPGGRSESVVTVKSQEGVG